MMNIKNLKQYIWQHGKVVGDKVEIIGATMELDAEDIRRLWGIMPLNDKYKPELKDIENWIKSSNALLTRRQVVYFNDSEYLKRLQCISLFQILDSTMVVYQRSSDTTKTLDDYRFFVEIIKRYFPDVQSIKIFYGSLHTQL